MPSSVATPRRLPQLHVELERELKARVEALAEQRGCFQSRIVRDALIAYFALSEQRAQR